METTQVTQNETGYIKLVEAAKFLGVSTRTLDTHVSKGRIPYYRLGKLRLFKRADLVAGMERFRVASKGEILE